MNLLSNTISKISSIDHNMVENAKKRLNSLLKPEGSLGKLEDIAMQLAGIQSSLNPKILKKSIMIFAADNGIAEESVSSFGKEVSTLIAKTMVTGLSGVAVLARQAKAELHIVDIGLDTEIEINGIINRKIRRGTSNFTKTAAMSREEAIKAIEVGIEETNKVIEDGADCVGTGEVGISNTTTSSAVLYALTKRDLHKITGKGAGISDEGLIHKIDIIRKGVEFTKPNPSDPIDVLAKVGGFDLAGLTGVYLACAAKRVPVVIDGFISGVAAIIAYKLKPECTEYMIASHCTEEPGGKVVSEILGKSPMLQMNMRLGEGTGCALSFNILESACAIINEMGSFSDIGM